MLAAYARSVPPWVLVVVALTVALAGVGLVLLLRRGRRDLAGWTLFSGVLVVIAVIKFSPSIDPFDTSWCGLGEWRPIRPNQLLSMSHDALNVWVFVVLGVAAAALPGRHFVLGAAIALIGPLAVESTQYLLPVLGRSCQSTDLINNWTGGLAGLVIAAALRAFRR